MISSLQVVCWPLETGHLHHHPSRGLHSALRHVYLVSSPRVVSLFSLGGQRSRWSSTRITLLQGRSTPKLLHESCHRHDSRSRGQLYRDASRGLSHPDDSGWQVSDSNYPQCPLPLPTPPAAPPTFRLPVAERRGYTNVFNALSRITREEGVLTLWRVS